MRVVLGWAFPSKVRGFPKVQDHIANKEREERKKGGSGGKRNQKGRKGEDEHKTP